MKKSGNTARAYESNDHLESSTEVLSITSRPISPRANLCPLRWCSPEFSTAGGAQLGTDSPDTDENPN